MYIRIYSYTQTYMYIYIYIFTYSHSRKGATISSYAHRLIVSKNFRMRGHRFVYALACEIVRIVLRSCQCPRSECRIAATLSMGNKMAKRKPRHSGLKSSTCQRSKTHSRSSNQTVYVYTYTYIRTYIHKYTQLFVHIRIHNIRRCTEPCVTFPQNCSGVIPGAT
jgi:hypothetical protein